jgi:hypothetical protein
MHGWFTPRLNKRVTDFHEADGRQRILCRAFATRDSPPLLIPPMDVYLSNGCALSALQRASAFSQSVYFVAHVASF